tara:strand:+ start:16913 stop:17524 length:612 start_codon:yes stop_codon:yes gene_type:complete
MTRNKSKVIFLSNGFTIIELLIVISIVGFLASISIPSSLKWIYKEKQNSYIRETIGYIELVRREARRWNGSCSVKAANIPINMEGYPLSVECKGMDNTKKVNIARQRPYLGKDIFQEVSNDFFITPKGHISMPSSNTGNNSVVIVIGERHDLITSLVFPKCIVIEAPSAILRTGIYQNYYRYSSKTAGSKKNPSLRGTLCRSN